MPSSLITHNDLLKAMGARIKSELNDLKRTPESCAQELGIPIDHVQSVLDGSAGAAEILAFIDTLGDHYPIDKSDLLLLADDCLDGAKIMRSAESKASSRVFDRADRSGARTPYYEYRDTAMSRLAPFKPEWIKEERVVHDAQADNPDVVFNNGHLMHQITFFIGPVNFYYKVGDRAHCVEMTTGDSNYIMPFFPHSFTSRDPDQTALIIAVTFGGDVRRAQKELYALGERGEKYHLDFRNQPPRVGLLRQHLANSRVTPEALDFLLSRSGSKLTAARALDPAATLEMEDFRELAEVLELHPSDLMAADYAAGDDVKVVFRKDRQPYPFPSQDNRHYAIRTLAQHKAMPLVKSLDLEVLGTSAQPEATFCTGLHTYVYNYGEHPVSLTWTANGNTHQTDLAPEDSVYLQPFVDHSFVAHDEGRPGNLLMVSLPGFVGLSASKEFSYFESASRVVRETKKWFD
jgi:methylphosphonate synthase